MPREHQSVFAKSKPCFDHLLNNLFITIKLEPMQSEM